MIRQIHDQFAKHYLAEFLEAAGQVTVNCEISSEPHHADLCFQPNLVANLPSLGLLGEMVATTCLLEPFRKPPTPTEIRTGLLKLVAWQSELQRQLAKTKQPLLAETALPRLWILATSASQTVLADFGGQLRPPPWGEGVYFLPEGLKTAIVSINRLPSTPDTLWLRLLGKGTVQQQAITEVLALPTTQPLRHSVLELLANWKIYLGNRDQLTDDEQEVFMNLSPAYLKWREDTLREGLQQGLQQGVLQGLQQGVLQGLQQGRVEMQQLVVKHLLALRFGVVDEVLLEALLPLPAPESLRLILQLSREELFARLGKPSAVTADTK